MLLSDRMIETKLAAAAAFIFPESGRSVGIARNAIFAANSTAAYVACFLLARRILKDNQRLTLTTSCCHPLDILPTKTVNGAWKTILSMYIPSSSLRYFIGTPRNNEETMRKTLDKFSRSSPRTLWLRERRAQGSPLKLLNLACSFLGPSVLLLSTPWPMYAPNTRRRRAVSRLVSYWHLKYVKQITNHLRQQQSIQAPVPSTL